LQFFGLLYSVPQFIENLLQNSRVLVRKPQWPGPSGVHVRPSGTSGELKWINHPGTGRSGSEDEAGVC
jgi:hypothetical protein